MLSEEAVWSMSWMKEAFFSESSSILCNFLVLICFFFLSGHFSVFSILQISELQKSYEFCFIPWHFFFEKNTNFLIQVVCLNKRARGPCVKGTVVLMLHTAYQSLEYGLLLSIQWDIVGVFLFVFCKNKLRLNRKVNSLRGPGCSQCLKFLFFFLCIHNSHHC